MLIVDGRSQVAARVGVCRSDVWDSAGPPDIPTDQPTTDYTLRELRNVIVESVSVCIKLLHLYVAISVSRIHYTAAKTDQ